MVYLDNTTQEQTVYIPREGFLAGGNSGGNRYLPGDNISISPSNVISVTGMTEAISAATSDFVTSGDVHSQIVEETSDFVTSGTVETMISSSTQGLASETYVDNAVSGKADTTAVTQSISNALTSYTPTSNFATINGSAITEGGDIVIQGGGDSTSLEEITTLPSSPIDGAVYNYNGVLIKYVNGAGDWGYWTGLQSIKGYGQTVLGCATLFYGVMPSSMDGELAFGAGWITSSSADSSIRIWAFFDLQNNVINVYDNKDKTGDTIYTIVKNAGSETEIRHTSAVQLNVSWNDNVLQIRANDSNSQLLRYCNVASSTAHYELVDEPEYNYPNTITNIDNGYNVPAGRLGVFSADNRVVTPGAALTEQSIYINNSNYGNVLKYYGSTRPVSNIYVPITYGDVGSLCVAQGISAAPIWKTVAQALGVDFWVGTQSEYDAIITKSATTLYFIKPN